MNFYEKVKDLDQKTRRKKIEKRISSLEKRSRKENGGNKQIGYHVGYNPERKELIDRGDKVEFNLEATIFCNGYIPRGSEIVYGLHYNNFGEAGNHGKYYTIDDDSYIYDFFDYMDGVEVVSDFEMFNYIEEFLRSYFGFFPDGTRDERFRLIAKNDDRYYAPTIEHSIKSFKKTGRALCSEYAIHAQNILQVLGYDCCMIIGNVEQEYAGNISHAFNLISYKPKASKEINDFLIDFASMVSIYDENYERLGLAPFMGKIEDLSDDFLNDFVEGKEKLVFEDYEYVLIGGSLFKIGYSQMREYRVDTNLIPDQDIEKTRTYQYKK